MTGPVRFQVAGIPKPQGSKRGFVVKGRVVMAESAGVPLKDWRAQVGHAAGETMTGSPPIDEACTVRVVFFLPRPKSAPKWQWLPARRPDIDKLARAVLDALTGVVIADDALVVELIGRKVYAIDRGAGADVMVTPIGWHERQASDSGTLLAARSFELEGWEAL